MLNFRGLGARRVLAITANSLLYESHFVAGGVTCVGVNSLWVELHIRM